MIQISCAYSEEINNKIAIYSFHNSAGKITVSQDYYNPIDLSAKNFRWSKPLYSLELSDSLYENKTMLLATYGLVNKGLIMLELIREEMKDKDYSPVSFLRNFGGMI